jgi:hypothetical protein
VALALPLGEYREHSPCAFVVDDSDMPLSRQARQITALKFTQETDSRVASKQATGLSVSKVLALTFSSSPALCLELKDVVVLSDTGTREQPAARQRH